MRAHHVRIASAEDAAAIAQVHVDSWRVTYQDLLPGPVLDNLSVPDFEQRWSERLGASAADEHTWVVRRDAAVVGFAVVGPCRDAATPLAELVELYAIYVQPRLWGQGCGRALLDNVLAVLRARAHARLCTWVLEANHRAQSFCRAAGFAADGGTKVMARHGAALRELRYTRVL